LAEACHKVMLAEAKKRFGLDLAGLVRVLQNRPSLIRQLTDSLGVVEHVQGMGIRVEPVSVAVLAQGRKVSRDVGLLTNDATMIAMMRQMGMRDLATNDAVFDSVPGINVWKPR
jgi:predicted nucleic acid-binding protein